MVRSVGASVALLSALCSCNAVLGIETGELAADAGSATTTTASGSGGAPPEGWARAFGDGKDQGVVGVASDSAGNVYVVGNFQGSIDLGGGVFTSHGDWDVFLAKLDPNGEPLWQKQFGDQLTDLAGGIAVDPSGKVFVTGGFTGAVDFGTGALSSPGDSSVFVAAFSADGDALWARGFGGAGPQIGLGVAAGVGSVVVTGSYGGSIDFGGGPVISAGGVDAFVLRLDSSGNTSWATAFASKWNEQGRGAAITPNGDVVVAGWFDGDLTIGVTGLVVDGPRDAFVVELGGVDASLHWVAEIGGLGDDLAAAVASDGNGAAYVAGWFEGDAAFGVGTATAVGGRDGFVARFDGDGGLDWVAPVGGALDDALGAVAVTGDGAVAVGSAKGSVKLGEAGHANAKNGVEDLLLAYVGSNGALFGGTLVGGVGQDQGSAVALTPDGDRIVGGTAVGPIDLGTGLVTTKGGLDAIVAKLPH